MKKYFLLGVVILIIISGTSCKTSSESKTQNSRSQVEIQSNSDNSGNTERKNEMTNDPPVSSGYSPIETNQSKLDSILDRINNTSPYDELITKEIDINLFISKCDPDPTIPLFTSISLITKVDTEFGVECLRKTEANTLYSVHKVKQGGLLYVFYRNHSYETTGNYTEIKNWYYLKNKLKYQDFSSVVNGTDIKKVADIDPATNIFIERANKYDKSLGTATYHYLEDGILMLFYEYKNGEFEVIGQDYQEDFQVKLFLKEAKEEQYNGRVLPMDLIK